MTNISSPLIHSGRKTLASSAVKTLSSPYSSKVMSSFVRRVGEFAENHHHLNIYGDNRMRPPAGAVVYRGIRDTLPMDKAFAPQGEEKSLSFHVNVGNRSSGYVSSTEYPEVAQNFAKPFGVVYITNYPKICVDVNQSMRILNSKQTMPSMETDWNSSNEFEIAGVCTPGNKSVIDFNDVLMARKTMVFNQFYGPLYVNPDYRPSPLTIMIGGSDDECAEIKRATGNDVITYQEACQYLEEFQRLQENFEELSPGMPMMPPVKIATPAQAEFYLSSPENFSLLYMSDNIVEKLVADEAQNRNDSMHAYRSVGFFRQPSTAKTQARTIADFYPEDAVVSVGIKGVG